MEINTLAETVETGEPFGPADELFMIVYTLTFGSAGSVQGTYPQMFTVRYLAEKYISDSAPVIAGKLPEGVTVEYDVVKYVLVPF